jgi:hypothetical protein
MSKHYNTRSLSNLHLDAYKSRAKDFYTPVVKKEINFTDEEQILKKTMNPLKLSNNHYNILSKYGTKESEWDKDNFYAKTVSFTKPPSPKNALSKVLQSTVYDVLRR